MKGERECPDLSSHLAAISVKMTPRSAAPEQRITLGGRAALEPCPERTGEGIRAKKARSQAGNNAASPKNQQCFGPGFGTHLRIC